MRNTKVTRVLGKKFSIGRLALPIWAIGAAVALVGAVAGQAIGPVLTGSTSGTVNLTVGQAVTLATGAGNELGSNPAVYNLTGSGDSATTRNDEGTAFTIAVEMTQGARVNARLDLANHSGKDASAVMQLNVPAGIDVSAKDIGAQMNGLAQLNANSWLMVVKSGASDTGTDGIELTIEPKDDLAPGFYTISGRIVQTAG